MDGASTLTAWKRRSNAASFSMYLRYSLSVVAPMHCSSPRLSAGLMMFEASIVPSAEPAPTMVCNSSMNRMMFFERRISSMTALIRSSNWPRYLVPATIKARSRVMTRRSRSSSGTLPAAISCARPSTMAVLPNASLAQQHRIVLGAAAQNLNHPLNFALPADDRVHLALAGDLGQIAAEGLERGGFDFALLLRGRFLRGFAGSRFILRGEIGIQFLQDLLPGLFDIHIQVLEDPRGNAIALRGADPAGCARCPRRCD